ncbi:MAG: hypothetical protein ACLUSL_11645 [Ruminococcus sp.]
MPIIPKDPSYMIPSSIRVAVIGGIHAKSHTPALLQKPYTTLSLAAIIIADFRPIVKHHFWKKRRALTSYRNPVKKILHFFKKGLHCDVKCAIIPL